MPHSEPDPSSPADRRGGALRRVARHASAVLLAGVTLATASPSLRAQDQESDHALARGLAWDLGSGEAAGIDREALKRHLDGARVVALGSPLQGAREIDRHQARLARLLIEEMGFTALVLEAPLSEAMDLQTWLGTPSVHDGATPLEEAASLTGALQYAHWRGPELADTLEALRRLNSETPPDGDGGPRARLYGMDCQSTVSAATGVIRFLERADRELARSVRGTLEPLADPYRSIFWLDGMAPRDLARLRRDLESLAERFGKQRQRWSRTVGDDAWNVADRRLKTLLQALEIRDARGRGRHQPARSQAMADNVLWILEREGPEARIVLWAHSGHLATKPYANTGRLLREALGAAYRPIGFTFGQGRVATSRSPSGPSHAVNLPRPDSVEARLEPIAERLGTPALLWDLRPGAMEAPEAPEAGERPEATPLDPAWSSPLSMRYAVGPYDPADSGDNRHRIVVPDFYDALVYVRRVTPTGTGAPPVAAPPTSPLTPVIAFDGAAPGERPTGWSIESSPLPDRFRWTTVDAGCETAPRCALLESIGPASRFPVPVYGEAVRRIDASSLTGAGWELRARLRTDGAGRAMLWVAGRGGGRLLFLEDGVAEPAEAGRWTTIRYRFEPTPRLEEILLGVVFSGIGGVRVEAIEVRPERSPG